MKNKVWKVTVSNLWWKIKFGKLELAILQLKKIKVWKLTFLVLTFFKLCKKCNSPIQGLHRRGASLLNVVSVLPQPPLLNISKQWPLIGKQRQESSWSCVVHAQLLFTCILHVSIQDSSTDHLLSSTDVRNHCHLKSSCVLQYTLFSFSQYWIANAS
jgi:hypothetical protein